MSATKQALSLLFYIVMLLAAPTGCAGALTPSPLPVITPLPLFPTPRSIPTPESLSTPFHEESPDEFREVIPIPTPTFSLLLSTPDLTPPPGGWIAFRTPEGRLALISPDASRFIPLTEQGEVLDFAWSPDGQWLAFTIRLPGLAGGQLALISVEDSTLMPLTPPGTVEREFTWSQDSHSLAYLWRINPEKDRSSLALRLFDLFTHQIVTLTTYSNTLLPEPEVPSLCTQPFSGPLLPVTMMESPDRGSLQIWDIQAGRRIVDLGSARYCKYLWLPKGNGLVFAKVELGKEGIRMEGVENETLHPVSLAFWQVGDKGPTVVLEGTKQQHYYPTHWLPDGRLEVYIPQWDKAEYKGPAQPEHEGYRFFYISKEGEVREGETGDLPWWAAGGFERRLTKVQLPQPWGRLSGWSVAPDGETVIFTWSWKEGEELKSVIYLWRGKGEPRRLSMGVTPQWQPDDFEDQGAK